jgi:hypothetical protein
LISNAFNIIENDVQQDESEPINIEVEDEMKKIIQKETIQTGSVSFLSSILSFLDDLIIDL